MIQMAARAAYFYGKSDDAQKLQQRAYASNNNLFRPQIQTPYIALTPPGDQARTIAEQVVKFQIRPGCLAEFDHVVSHLVPEASSGQFEQALANLGRKLGFTVERPDNTYGVGPDVLWLLPEKLALIIEAKSRKEEKNALTKGQHGQLLQATEWFEKEYPGYSGIRVSVHPNARATKSVTPGDSKALTLDKLAELVRDTRLLLQELCTPGLSQDEIEMRCEQLLQKSHLQPQKLIQHYLVPFTEEK
jgi:Holliday junction resolvase